MVNCTKSLVNIDIELVEVARGGGNVTLTFRHRYRPLHSMLGSGGADAFRLVVRYPTHSYTYDAPALRPLDTTFVVTAPASALKYAVREDRVNVGTPIEFIMGLGEVCYAGLYSGGEVVGRATRLGCGPVRVPTDASVAGTEPTIRLVAYSAGEVRYAELEPGTVSVAPAVFSMDLTVEPYDVLTGDPFSLHVDTKALLSGCRVTIMDAGGIPLMVSEFEGCSNILLGTSSAWTSGEHYIHVKAFAGNRTAEASTVFVVRGEGRYRTGPELVAEQTMYAAGEEVRLSGKDLGSKVYCHASLKTPDGIQLREVDSQGCRKIHFPLAEEMAGGNYIISVDVFKRGRLVGRGSYPIQVRPWKAKRGTQMFRLCPGGFLRLDEERLACIRSGGPCVPSSLAVPLCPCFDKDEKLIDVCHHGESCAEMGCIEQETMPFIIVYHDGQCTARRGAHTIRCVQLGELCMDSCVCLSAGGKPLGRCIAGDSCTERGCEEPHLTFRVDSIEPGTVREYEVMDGIEMRITGVLEYDGSPIGLSGTEATVRVAGLEAPARGEEVIGSIQVVFTAPLEGELPPGEHGLKLLIRRGNDQVTVIRPFEVWYPDDHLTIDPVEVPTYITRSDIEAGQPVQFQFKLYDAIGEVVAGVPASAMSLDVEGYTTSSLASVYEGGTYAVSGILEGDRQPGRVPFTFSTDHLGKHGSFSDILEVRDVTPLDVSIIDVEPGTKERPLLRILFGGLGADMDLYLSVSGVERITKENARIRLNGKDVTDLITYTVNTNKGVRVHLTNINLCPDIPPADAKIILDVRIQREGMRASDEAVVHTRGNPGDWSSQGVVGCG